MNSDGKLEIFGGVKGQTNLMIIKDDPKNRALEYCDNIVLINCDIELSNSMNCHCMKEQLLAI